MASLHNESKGTYLKNLHIFEIDRFLIELFVIIFYYAVTFNFAYELKFNFYLSFKKIIRQNRRKDMYYV